MKRFVLVCALAMAVGCSEANTPESTPTAAVQATATAAPARVPVNISYRPPDERMDSAGSVTSKRTVASMSVDLVLWWVVEEGVGRCYLYERLPRGGTLTIDLQPSVCRDQGLMNEAPSVK